LLKIIEMRYLKHVIAVVFLVAFSLLLTNFLEQEEGFFNYYWLFLGVIVVIFLFNFYASSRLRYKSYFTNRLNIFAAKTSRSFKTEIPRVTIIDKLQEVLKENGWTVQEIDKDKGEILANTGISFRSWGEIIYVDVIEEGIQSEVIIHSVALFQIYMWGKNEDNLDQFLHKFEDSLIV